jgi:hypothetical protein
MLQSVFWFVSRMLASLYLLRYFCLISPPAHSPSSLDTVDVHVKDTAYVEGQIRTVQ